MGYWLTLLLAVPAAGFMVRVFILFHDCCHGSFLKTQKANDRMGLLLGVLVWTPYYEWKHDHAIHHATAGDLDRRGVGDVYTMTVEEIPCVEYETGYVSKKRLAKASLFLNKKGTKVTKELSLSPWRTLCPLCFSFEILRRKPLRHGRVIHIAAELVDILGALGI